MGDLRLSPKHGVNATIPCCFFCMQEKHEIILAGRMKTKTDNDVEAPRGSVWDKEPCAKCVEYMKQGIILISVRDGETSQNSYRTGGWVVVRDEFFTQMNDTPLIQSILEGRVTFIPDEAWDMMGLPRPESVDAS